MCLLFGRFGCILRILCIRCRTRKRLVKAAERSPEDLARWKYLLSVVAKNKLKINAAFRIVLIKLPQHKLKSLRRCSVFLKLSLRLFLCLSLSAFFTLSASFTLSLQHSLFYMLLNIYLFHLFLYALRSAGRSARLRLHFDKDSSHLTPSVRPDAPRSTAFAHCFRCCFVNAHLLQMHHL